MRSVPKYCSPPMDMKEALIASRMARENGMKVIAIGAVLSLVGCASVELGANKDSKDVKDVAINVEPAEATVTTDLGMSCGGSCVLKVPRLKSFTVTASAPGYESQS